MTLESELEDIISEINKNKLLIMKMFEEFERKILLRTIERKRALLKGMEDVLDKLKLKDEVNIKKLIKGWSKPFLLNTLQT